MLSVRPLHAERHPAVYDTAGQVFVAARDKVPGASFSGSVSAGPRLIVHEGQFTRRSPQCPLFSHSGWQVFSFQSRFSFCATFFLIFFIGTLRSLIKSGTVYRRGFGLRFGRALFDRLVSLLYCYFGSAHRLDSPQCPSYTMMILFVSLWIYIYIYKYIFIYLHHWKVKVILSYWLHVHSSVDVKDCCRLSSPPPRSQRTSAFVHRFDVFCLGTSFFSLISTFFMSSQPSYRDQNASVGTFTIQQKTYLSQSECLAESF